MTTTSFPSIGVVIPTLNSAHHLQHCLPPLLNSSLKPKVLIVDSSSSDQTLNIAQHLKIETLVIPKHEFNHGLTREKARQHLKTDITVMLTPDAYAIDEYMLEKSVKPFIQKKAAITYARQIPHVKATFFEAFPREFNYPSKSHFRELQDMHLFGIYTFFCSNSCAAYSNEIMDKIGGFQPVLLGEDTVAVAQVLQKGYSVAYVAEAIVKHSHRYTLLDEFRRYFDTGLARLTYGHLFYGLSENKRGQEFVKEMMKRLLKEKPHLIPFGFLHILAKWLGYKIGQNSSSFPVWLKKLLSSQRGYWDSEEFLRKSKKI